MRKKANRHRARSFLGLLAMALLLMPAGCAGPVDVDAVLESRAGNQEAPARPEGESSHHEGESSYHEEESSRESSAPAEDHHEESRAQESAAQQGGHGQGTHRQQERQDRQHKQEHGHSAPQATPAAPADIVLTEQQAKDKALAHAGLSAGEAEFTKVELGREDGRQVYELEFHTPGWMEYDYELDALTGEILEWSREQEDLPAPPTQAPTPTPAPTADPVPEPAGISAGEAQSLALARVPGASAGDMVKFETDYDDGRTVYEGEIVFGGMEYEFEIDAATGAVLEWDAEPVDD